MTAPTPYVPRHNFDIMREAIGWPGYFVRDDGVIASGKRKRLTVLKQWPDKDGYAYVVLFFNGKRQNVRVHRLVLNAFAEPRSASTGCRHLDGDKSNNSISNLCWGTQAENIADKMRHGTCARGERSGMAKLSKGDVEWIRAHPKRRGMFTEMARRLQVSRGTIRHAYDGTTWSHV